MAKAVLGNDPFQRGAAPREPPAVQAAEPPKARPPARKGWKARSTAGARTTRTGQDLPSESGQAAATPSGEQRGAPVHSRDTGAAAATAAPVEKSDLVKGAWRALRAALGLGDAPLDPYGEDPQLVRDLSPVADFLYDRYWRVTVRGGAKLPAGGCLLVANRAGALPLDGPILRLALARHRPELPRARWLAEEGLLSIPILGVLLNRLGAVPATPENALQLLAERRQLIVFPEGTQGINKSLRRPYELKPFGRGGFVKIAARAQVPIVPVAIVGAAEALPVLANVPIRSFGLRSLPLMLPPLPTKWSICIGQPLEVTRVRPDDASEVGRWTEQARSSVQQMLEEMLKDRRSIFAG